MEETLQAQLGTLRDEARDAVISAECKQTAVWCMGQLPTLYTKFQQTSESRYGEEINRLVKGVLKELGQKNAGCAESQKLAANITDRLQLIHEQFGLPPLELRTPGTPTPRKRKAS